MSKQPQKALIEKRKAFRTAKQTQANYQQKQPRKVKSDPETNKMATIRID